jgi:protein SCO1/2
MRLRYLIQTFLAASTLAASSAAIAQSAPPSEGSVAMPITDNSLFLLDGEWTRENGQVVTLASFAGRPTVLVMFYASCRMACPVLLADLDRLETAIDPALLNSVQFVLVTMDPERDSTEVLSTLASNYQFDMSRWALLRADMSLTRELAALLGVRFRGDQADGQISHSNILTLLDPSGEITLQVEGLRQPIETMRDAIEAMLR